MITIDTAQGQLLFDSIVDINVLIRDLEAKIHEVQVAERWQEIAARTEFTALADPLSMDAVEQNPTVYIEAELVFWADRDDREHNSDWILREYAYYKICDKKYRVDPADFTFGFDMNAIEWDGDEEERGGEFKEVKAKAAIYLACTTKQLAERKI